MKLLTRLLKPILRWYIEKHARAALVDYEQTCNLAGLQAPVEILRDQWAIPHIYASNEADMYMAQGWVHAQDRLWQMDMYRRIARGRLAEYVGEAGLEADRVCRTLGFGRLAEQDWQELEPRLKTLLQAYSEGVNTWLAKQQNLPPEHKLLRLKSVEPWSPVDSLAIARFMAFSMNYGWAHELVRMELAGELGEELARELFPKYGEHNPHAMGKSSSYRRLSDGRLEAFSGPFFPFQGASNSWVVAAERMQTGSACLANDPHLLISMPGIWYENHLSCPEQENTGVSIAGAPLILIGHNRKIAWGCTLSFADSQDLFIEEFESKDSRQYHAADKLLKTEVYEEKIYIKGKSEPFIELVLCTERGPIISNFAPQELAEQLDSRSDTRGYPKLCLASPALRKGSMISGFYALNKAENWPDFVRACTSIAAPSLNIVYADSNDNIGYMMTGKIPLRRKKKRAFLPAKGSKLEEQWLGFIPPEEMPHCFNPPQGYFYTCNHKIVNEEYPYDLGELWMNGYRAARLQELFDANTDKKLSLADFRAWQMDMKQLSGMRFQSYVAQNPLELQTALGKKALALIGSWDGFLHAQSAGGCILQVWKQKLINILMQKLGLSQRQANTWRGKGPEALILRLNEFLGHDGDTLLRLLQNPESPLWVKKLQGYSPEAWAAEAFEAACQELREQLGPEPEDWHWGKLHQLRYEHILGAKQPLDEFFNRGPYPIGGDGDTLCQTSFSPGGGFDGSLVAASYRQIIDMSRLDESLCMSPSGQSGNFLSPHYAEHIEPWLKGEYRPMLWSRRQVEAHQRYKQLLRMG